MPGDKINQVVAAIELLAEEAGGSLDSKPNVADVERHGVDTNRGERDEAWGIYQDRQAAEPNFSVEPGEPAAVATKDQPASAPVVGATEVTNRHARRLLVNEVLIEPGATESVPRFDGSRGALKAWLKAGVISAT